MAGDWRVLIRERQELRVDPNLPMCWLAEERTPAHRFTYVFFERGGCLFVIAIRDEFHEEGVLALIKSFEASGSLCCTGGPIVVLARVSFYHERFDSIGVLRSDAHGLFPRLAENGIPLYSIFPMARCEFSGDESLEMLRAMRRDFVCTLDWGRAISPKVLMRVSNSRTKVRSRGKGRVLATLSGLRREVGLLKGARDSWLEVENFRHRVLSLRTGADGEIEISAENGGATAPSGDPVDLAVSFVTGRV